MNNISSNFFKKISSNLDIPVSEIYRVLKIILDNKVIENNLFVRKAGIPKTQVGRILTEIGFLLKPPSVNIVLKDEFIDSLNIFLKENFPSFNEVFTEESVNFLNKIVENRQIPKRELDQFLATKETLLKRAKYLFENGDLIERNILFLGDDDHTSCIAADISKNSKINVLDIDRDVLDSVKNSNSKLSINTTYYDVREKLDQNLKQKFDVVFTDPPYSSAGISLFLNRSIELLKPKISSRIYLCYGNSERARERELEIQIIISNFGLRIRDKISHFNEYLKAESIGSISSLYVLDFTPKTKNINLDLNKNIYTI